MALFDSMSTPREVCQIVLLLTRSKRSISGLTLSPKGAWMRICQRTSFPMDNSNYSVLPGPYANPARFSLWMRPRAGKSTHVNFTSEVMRISINSLLVSTQRQISSCSRLFVPTSNTKLSLPLHTSSTRSLILIRLRFWIMEGLSNLRHQNLSCREKDRHLKLCLRVFASIQKNR